MENEGNVSVGIIPGAFDASVFDTKTKANEGIEVEILKPDGESSGLFIRVLGVDSDAYQELSDKQERARVKALSKGGRNVLDNLYETTKDNMLDLVVAATLGWRHASGESLNFDIGADKKSAKAFYKTYPVVYNQVRAAVSDPSNFTKASVKP